MPDDTIDFKVRKFLDGNDMERMDAVSAHVSKVEGHVDVDFNIFDGYEKISISDYCFEQKELDGVLAKLHTIRTVLDDTINALDSVKVG